MAPKRRLAIPGRRMLIVDLEPGEEESIRQTATLLVEGFKDNWPDAWPNMDATLVEVRESFGEERISRVAVDEGGTALGWIGGIPSYEGNVRSEERRVGKEC